MRKINALCLATLGLLLWGCIADDLSDCGVSIQYRFVKNVEGTDKFATSVERITLFVFDGEGNYVGSYTDEGAALAQSGYRMNVPLRPGTYSLVAWGNLADEYELPEFTPYTNIDDVILSLRSLDNIVEEHPAHLFFGREDIEITGDGSGRTDVLVDMTKDTNTIRVTVKGLPIEEGYADESGGVTAQMPYACTITSANRSYKFDNSIAGNDRLTYIPRATASHAEQTMQSGFVTMRELNDGSTGSRLIIHNSGTTTKSATLPATLLDAALTPFLLGASVTGDLDIDDDFDLEVIFDYTSGTAVITINGWTYSNGEWVVG